MSAGDVNLRLCNLVLFRLREFIALGEGADAETTRLALEALITVVSADVRRDQRDAHIRAAAALLAPGKPWTKACALSARVKEMRRSWKRYEAIQEPLDCSSVTGCLLAASRFGDIDLTPKQFNRVLKKMDIEGHCDVHATEGMLESPSTGTAQ